MPVNHVTFKNIELGGKLGIEVMDAKNITFDNLTISNKAGSPASISFSDSITIDKLKITETAPEKLPIEIHDISHVQLTKLEYHSGKEMVKITGKAEHLEFDKSIPEKKIFRETK